MLPDCSLLQIRTVSSLHYLSPSLPPHFRYLLRANRLQKLRFDLILGTNNRYEPHLKFFAVALGIAKSFPRAPLAMQFLKVRRIMHSVLYIVCLPFTRSSFPLCSRPPSLPYRIIILFLMPLRPSYPLGQQLSSALAAYRVQLSS